MNKRGLLKFITVLITTIISIYFILTSKNGFNSLFNNVLVLNFILAITIFMFANKKYFNKNRIINIAFILLIIISTLYVGLYIYNIIIAIMNDCYSFEFVARVAQIYPTLLIMILLFSFKDIFVKTNLENDILVIVVSLIVILVHVIYYMFINDLSFTTYSSDLRFNYIAKYYFYFSMMYLITLVQRKLN